MNELFSLITAIGISLLVSTIILLVIVKPLRQILAQLCENAEATPFWVAFTIVMLFATPLFFALLWTPLYHATAVFALRSAMLASLFGAIAGLVIVGFKLASAKQI